MKAQKRIRISQCMIVKDEEQSIERALSWGKEILWEQIVVDTGSTDQTAEIAESMGAKVYHLEWADDFAAAKNFAISKAKGDWIKCYKNYFVCWVVLWRCAAWFRIGGMPIRRP